MYRWMLCLSVLFICSKNLAFGAAMNLADYVNTTANSITHCNFNEISESTSRCGNGLSGGQWCVKWSDGTEVCGTSQCNNVSGTHGEIGKPGFATNGENCWCKTNTYSLLNQKRISFDGNWIFYDGLDLGGCRESCASFCAIDVKSDFDFQQVMFGDVVSHNFSSDSAISILHDFFENVNTSKSRWKTINGNFNTGRLISDLTAGVVLGTVGGVVSGVVIKKKQLEKGFDVLHCSVAGQPIAGWGDEFNVEFNE